MVIGFVVAKWGWHAGFGLADSNASRFNSLFMGTKILDSCWEF
jgi:hypothetical protein